MLVEDPEDLRVVVNALAIVPGATGGVETYARALTRALAELVEVTVVVTRDADDGGWPSQPIVLPFRAASRAQLVDAEQLVLPRRLAVLRPHLVHSLANTAPLFTRCPSVVTVHDLHHRTDPDAHTPLYGLGMRLLVTAAARRARRIITVSEASAAEIHRLLRISPDRIDVTTPGPGRIPTTPTPVEEVRRRLSLSTAPVIVSSIPTRGHKNADGLVRAVAELSDLSPQLVLTGYAGPADAEVRALARDLGVDLTMTGWITDADFDGLMSLADVLVVPSRTEGFGLPAVEAMARGLPVVSGQSGGLREATGGAALVVDPTSFADLATGLRRALTDQALRAQLVDAGRRRAAELTWTATAQATVAAYRRALA